jgi:hypothetical protein
MTLDEELKLLDAALILRRQVRAFKMALEQEISAHHATRTALAKAQFALRQPPPL